MSGTPVSEIPEWRFLEARIFTRQTCFCLVLLREGIPDNSVDSDRLLWRFQDMRNFQCSV